MSYTFQCCSCKHVLAKVEGNSCSLLGNATIVTNFPPSNWNSQWLKCSNCNQFAVIDSGSAHDKKMAEMKRQQQLVAQRQQQEYERKRKEQQQKHNMQVKQTLMNSKNELVSDRQRVISSELYQVQTHISNINNQIVTEEKAIYKFSVERSDKSNRIIVLIGNTGDGKSTLANRLCCDVSVLANNGPFETSNANQSCTLKMQKYNKNKLCVIDCPGWNDGNGNDNAHTNNLCAFLRGSGGINAFIVVRNATNCRFDANFQRKLQGLGYVFGDAFWKNLIIVLTHVDKGMREMQFANGNKTKQMKEDVSKLCNGLNKNVAVIPIGLDNYSGKLKMIMNNVSYNRFMCDNIRSPIDDLKAKKNTLINKQTGIQHRINVIKNNINNVDRQINALNV
eukprot:62751_1